MTVCSKCARLGSGTWEIKAKPKLLTPTLKRASRSPLPRSQTKQPASFQIVESEVELVEGFGAKIKQARENLGLSHEELGKKINEKVSVLKKIEAEKMKPDMRLTAKLEHALKIRLVAPLSEPKPILSYQKTRVQGLTLGDLMQLKEEKTEEEKKRRQS